MMPWKIKDITGQKFNRFVVIKLNSQDYNGRSLWLCKCDCGNEKIIRSHDLQSGKIKSCGCLQREISSKIMKEQTGEKNPNYKNGTSKHTKEILELKKKIRKRDNYTCQKCGKTQEQSLKELNEILSVHHIDEDDTNNIEENMITYCRGCHKKLHLELIREI